MDTKINITKIAILIIIIFLSTSCGMETENRNFVYEQYNGTYEIISFKNKVDFSNNNWTEKNNINDYFELNSNDDKLEFSYCSNEECNQKEVSQQFTIDNQINLNFNIEANSCIISKIIKEIREIDSEDEVEIIVTEQEARVQPKESLICNNNLLNNNNLTFHFKKIEIIKGIRVE